MNMFFFYSEDQEILNLILTVVLQLDPEAGISNITTAFGRKCLIIEANCSEKQIEEDLFARGVSDPDKIVALVLM